MNLGVVVAEFERSGIGSTPSFGHKLRLKARPRRGHARGAPRRRGGFRREHNVDFGILGDRSRRACKRAAEQVDFLGHD